MRIGLVGHADAAMDLNICPAVIKRGGVGKTLGSGNMERRIGRIGIERGCAGAGAAGRAARAAAAGG